MTKVRRAAYATLIVLTGFLALTTFAGGISLAAGINAPPVSYLDGSIFQNYTVPGLCLFILGSRSAILATVLLVRKSQFALLSATVAAIIIMFFEFVEILVIGSPAGVAQALQIFYFGLAIGIGPAGSNVTSHGQARAARYTCSGSWREIVERSEARLRPRWLRRFVR